MKTWQASKPLAALSAVSLLSTSLFATAVIAILAQGSGRQALAQAPDIKPGPAMAGAPQEYVIPPETDVGPAKASAACGDSLPIRVDLEVDGVGEDKEEDPGFFIARNNDDDNRNGRPDYLDSPCPDEDDLAPMKITVMPSGVTGQVTLRAVSGGNKVRVWLSKTKEPGDLVPLPKTWAVGEIPAQLWLEGCVVSKELRDIHLSAELSTEGDLNGQAEPESDPPRGAPSP